MKIIITEGSALTNGDLDFDAFEKFGELKVWPGISYEDLEKNSLYRYPSLQ